MIKKITIKNFRGIKELIDFEFKKFSLLIGENGMSKTSILEAINFCLSPYYISGRIKHTDFYKGENCEIEIKIELNESFTVELPDGYTTQDVECNKVCLEIKKRERGSKAFSDIATVKHYALPEREMDNKEGWEQKRKTTETMFSFNERQLFFPLKSNALPQCFYFAKNRGKELKKGFNSSISSVFDDFNWRFVKENNKEKNPEPTVFDNIKETEEKIINTIPEGSYKRTFSLLNVKLKKIGLEETDISFIEKQAPFSNAFISKKLNNLNLSVTQIGSGIEMITSLLFLETLAEISKENIIILIDEPELHLHPDLQNKFVKHMLKTSTVNQFLLSSHSPLFVKQSLINQEESSSSIQLHCLKKREKDNEIETSKLEERRLSHISANEINYIAFGLATEEYYGELYNELERKYKERKENKEKNIPQKEFDEKFFAQEKNNPIDNKLKKEENKVTKFTYVRNKIYHSKENEGLPTPEEMKPLIKDMREYLKNDKVI